MSARLHWSQGPRQGLSHLQSSTADDTNTRGRSETGVAWFCLVEFRGSVISKHRDTCFEISCVPELGRRQPRHPCSRRSLLDLKVWAEPIPLEFSTFSPLGLLLLLLASLAFPTSCTSRNSQLQSSRRTIPISAQQHQQHCLTSTLLQVASVLPAARLSALCLRYDQKPTHGPCNKLFKVVLVTSWLDMFARKIAPSPFACFNDTACCMNCLETADGAHCTHTHTCTDKTWRKSGTTCTSTSFVPCWVRAEIPALLKN